MNAFEFMARSPILSFLLAYMIVHSACELLFRCWNRLVRHLNIRRAGWPPVHLDADGDWKPAPKQESKQ
uniref:Uncharacterized protein n=1 Tax=Pseudomonas phage Touem01 TaxID=3138548 RepID=A0AAU6W1U8_9VIRU